MASVSSQPQFRYTQPPSKVLHLRNLPWECTEEELIELGKPFGKVVNTKCNVGANRNQAFIEFADLNQAIAMISYYASSSEPAQVRGKTVYLQYSNRQEIVNNKTTADIAGNVLLVTIEGQDARLVSIDVLHLDHVKGIISNGSLVHPEKEHMCVCLLSPFLNTTSLPYSSLLTSNSYLLGQLYLLLGNLLVEIIGCNDFLESFYLIYFPFIFLKESLMQVFSAFGFVHKITTFEKTAGFQALVQFSDAETATSAKNALDGRIIPRYLLSENISPCTLRITYSAHTDLSVKFQSHRSRDYTNPYLPVAPSAIDGSNQFNLGLDGKKLEPESNVLLASIENMQYAVTLDVLHMVFSAFGPVQKIAMFDKNGALQALIQYPDVQTAIVAKEALEGHCIYDGGFCKLHLSYSRHTDLSIKVNNDRSRDYTIPNPAMVNPQPSVLGQQPVQTMGHQYNGTQYAPGIQQQQPTIPPQPSAGWGSSAVPPMPQPMMNNHNPYIPPASMPQMTPGMMQMPGQGGIPPFRPTHIFGISRNVQTAIAAKETCIEQLMIPPQPSAGCGASAVPAIGVNTDK
ncbi:polypyrimidine tract-binding protein-like protein 2 [Gossypium australe]|uniref:Polypyrimidine tract-binding protein-like protein 2 n=1 Tax=Gossypium australe TaxID=47621 RepID=A0A5B6UP90_9ROSI|nr:polypyrimidine tract-binding protein-like protein 2 [Gossypium australe]